MSHLSVSGDYSAAYPLHVWGHSVQNQERAQPSKAEACHKVAVASETHGYQERQFPITWSLSWTAFPKAHHKCFQGVQRDEKGLWLEKIGASISGIEETLSPYQMNSCPIPVLVYSEFRGGTSKMYIQFYLYIINGLLGKKRFSSARFLG